MENLFERHKMYPNMYNVKYSSLCNKFLEVMICSYLLIYSVYLLILKYTIKYSTIL